MNDLHGLPLNTYRHIHQLVKKRFASSDGPVNNPHEGALFDDDLWDEDGRPTTEVFDEIKKKLEDWGYVIGNGRFMAFIPNSGNFASCLGELLLGQMDGRNDPIAASIEKTVMRWMCDVVGYPKTADGYLTPGGTTSTVVAVATAREAKRIKSADYGRLVVYIQPRSHFALDKALEVAGLGGCEVHLVHIDKHHRMCPDDLKKWIRRHKEEGLIPFMIVGTIGTTELGSIDPINALANIANDNDIWFHVDGAIGGFYNLCDKMKKAFKGLPRADSMILDPHKTLSQPFGCGAVLFKEGHLKDLCCRVKRSDADVPFWQNPLEKTMMFRSFVVWFSTHAFGVDTFRAVLNRNLELARYLYDQLRVISQLKVLVPQQSIVVFRCRGPKDEANNQTELLFKTIDTRGRVFLSPTTMRGFFFIRVALTSFRNNLTEVKLCLEEIRCVIQDMFNAEIGHKDYKTKANVAWLHELDSKISWKEKILGLRYLDRVLRIVYCRIMHDEKEIQQEPLESLLQSVLLEKEEATHVDKLLEIASAIGLSELQKPECRLVSTIGHFLATCLNAVCGIRSAEPGAVQLEEKVISKFAVGLGMSYDCRGVLASDTWTANMLGFIAARKALLATCSSFSRALVYIKKEHKSHFKPSLNMIGLGECVVREVNCAPDGEMDIEDLERKITEDTKDSNFSPYLVVQRVQKSWAPENLLQVAELCDNFGMWHHVEVGHEGFSRLLENDKAKTDLGFGLTHSVTLAIDESLCLPVGVAAAIVKEHQYLYRAMTHYRPPEYLLEKKMRKQSAKLRRQSSVLENKRSESSGSLTVPEYEAKAYSFELSRPFRALPLWFTLRLLGTKKCS